jgi:nicotinamide/nicotinate riboside kinase
MDSVLSHLRETGAFPSSHSSHDHLNILPEVPLPEDFRQHWRERFQNALLSSASSSRSRPHLQIALVDGFLLYFSPLVRRHLDVRFLLRTSRTTLQRRREERQGYNTAEGTLWQDPPGYFDKVVWPAYVLAHRGLFEGGDVERGEPVRVKQDDGAEGGKFPGLVVLSGEGKSAPQSKGNVEEGSEMRLMVQKACEEVETRLKQLIADQQDSVDVA